MLPPQPSVVIAINNCRCNSSSKHPNRYLSRCDRSSGRPRAFSLPDKELMFLPVNCLPENNTPSSSHSCKAHILFSLFAILLALIFINGKYQCKIDPISLMLFT